MRTTRKSCPICFSGGQARALRYAVSVQLAGRGQFKSQADLDATVKSFQDQILTSILGAPPPPVRK
jgi:hypothetical protein